LQGKYIDKGNYAQVYECIRKDNGEKRAVKVLEKERLKSMKNGKVFSIFIKESVFNELKILRSLEHKNLMRLF
jgi:serine/threonine protein kinase